MRLCRRGHRGNPKYRARSHPRNKTVKVIVIYTLGTGETLSTAPGRIPGPPHIKP